VRLLAVDVDGTLLRSDGRLGQSVIDACRAAERAGCVIVPATARPPRSMQSILQTLGTAGPTINYNGAVIWNPLDRRAQFHEALEVEVVRDIIAEARGLLPEVLVSVEIMDRWFTDRVDPALHTETSRVFDPDFVGPIDSFLTEPVTKLMLLADPISLRPVLDLVRDQYWSQRRVAVFLTDPHIIQIAHPMVDKAIALQRVARRIGAAREEVMAIGDGPNDAGMVEWSGFGVAVENACDTVRALADAVVPSNDDLGVARAIQRYILNAG
jgi:Cof subfamily protein (haloacid dehalogenase superfamily)